MRCVADDVPGVLVDGEFVPDWLGVGDVPWLRDLLLVAVAFDGRTIGELRAAWRRGEVAPRAGARWRWVLRALEAIVVPRGRPGGGSALRAAVFAAAAGGASRAAALAAGARASGIAPGDVEAAMFADLGERRVVCVPAGCEVDTLRRVTNGAMARALLATANAAELELRGASRAVLRTAWLHGAHFRCAAACADGAARIVWAPAPGDRRAGRRLAAIVPVLAWAKAFALRAHCRWRGARAAVTFTSLDALPVGAPVAAFDSAWERELGEALVRECAGRGFEVVREPVPLRVGERLAFPDFGVRRVDGVEPPWWVELAGLRDAAALAGKVEVLGAVERYVLCVAAVRCPVGLARHPRVVPFRRGRLGDMAAAVCRVVAAPGG